MSDIERIDADTVRLTAEIVAAYVSHNTIVPERLPDFIIAVHAALKSSEASNVTAPKVELKPAVPIKKSVFPDYIICLEDGKRFKSLKRHLRTHYDLSPEQYRERWGLPNDYSMVAPNYAASRSLLARKMGLGQRRNGS